MPLNDHSSMAGGESRLSIELPFHVLQIILTVHGDFGILFFEFLHTIHHYYNTYQSTFSGRKQERRHGGGHAPQQ